MTAKAERTEYDIACQTQIVVPEGELHELGGANVNALIENLRREGFHIVHKRKLLDALKAAVDEAFSSI